MKKKFVLTFGLLGFVVALVLAGVRLYLLAHQPQYQEVLYGDWNWFDTVTMIFWPGSFYLSVMQSEEPLKVEVVVFSIAVLTNPILYGFIGWVFWRIAKAFDPSLGES